ncbi:AhpC/TSA family protein [Abyssalbus ytuae]|uniref:AhpC/TSA family protein n=1 Tax=Abyssalbus ytuae TaxID=2926907 RepID=A0A9E6ZPE2_9FLAO|nr:AhpC/TSA family protein [Abyssalbus ytuae]UOB18105.1 AhpC/TSA family protein [Abyssalbus ytuae]
MNKAIIITSLTILCNLFNTHSQNHTLIGYTSNLNDSTKVLLRNVEMDKPFDTTYIINNTFRFDIKPIDGHNLFFIRIDKLKGKRRDFLFIDNSDVEIDLRDRDFDSAIIKGGQIQNQKMEFLREINSESANYKAKVDFIKSHSNYEYCAYILMDMRGSLKNEEIKNLFDGLDFKIKNSKCGKVISKYIEKSKGFEIGSKVTDFTLKDINGNEVSLKSFYGKYIYLDFWASWCGICRKKHPFFNKMYEKYKNKGFEIISISLDPDPTKWKKASVKDEISWTSLVDTSSFNGDIALTYKVFSIPTGYIINRECIVIDRIYNGQLDENTIKRLFE